MHAWMTSEVPSARERAGEYTRFRRRLFVYRCTLASAGFKPPEQLPATNGQFSKEIRELMSKSPEIAQYSM